MRFRGSGPSGSTSSANWWDRDRTGWPDGARRRRLPRVGGLERIPVSRVRSGRSPLGRRCSARRRCRALASGALARVRPRGRTCRLVVGKRSTRSSRPERSRRPRRPLGRGRSRVTGPARRTRFTLRMPAECASLRVGAGRRARPPRTAARSIPAPRRASSPCERRSSRRARPRTASTSGAGLRGAASTSILRGRDWRVVGHRGGIGGLSDRLRAHVARSIAAGLEGERRAVLAGIVLGEDEGLSEELQASFKAAGLYHLLAVSGQNVAFLAGAVLGARLSPRDLAPARRGGGDRSDRRVCARRRVAAVGGSRRGRRRARLARLAGLAPTRSLALHGAGRRRSPRVDAGDALRAGFPALVRGRGGDLPPRLASEQRPRGLSHPRLAPRRAGDLDRLRCGDGADPLAPVRLHPGLCAPRERTGNPRDRAVARDRSPRHAARADPPSATVALAWLNGWLAAYIAACARIVGGLPLAETSSGLAVAALLLGPVATLLLRRLPPWRRPLALACVAAAFPALLLWLLWPSRPPAPPEGLRITVLDVGQGDSILVQVPEGSILVDQGPPEARVDRQLRGARGPAALGPGAHGRPARPHGWRRAGSAKGRGRAGARSSNREHRAHTGIELWPWPRTVAFP